MSWYYLTFSLLFNQQFKQSFLNSFNDKILQRDKCFGKTRFPKKYFPHLFPQRRIQLIGFIHKLLSLSIVSFFFIDTP